MKPRAMTPRAMALACVLAAACGKSEPGSPTAPETNGVDLSQQTIFTHKDVLAYLPLGKAEYRVAVVFLPGLRDPARKAQGLARLLLPGKRAGPFSFLLSHPAATRPASRSALTPLRRLAPGWLRWPHGPGCRDRRYRMPGPSRRGPCPRLRRAQTARR